MDIDGRLPNSEVFSYILTCMDRFARWPQAIPVENIGAETITRVYSNRSIALFNVSLILTTDQIRQFEANLFRRLQEMCGMKRNRTTAYDPSANCLVEQFHR